MGTKSKDDLEERVQQFNRLALPGQPLGMHMGTSYLVDDLWREVQRLRKIETAARELSERWKREALEMVPEVYSSRDLHYKYFKLDNEAGGMMNCADQILDVLNESEPK